MIRDLNIHLKSAIILSVRLNPLVVILVVGFKYWVSKIIISFHE